LSGIVPAASFAASLSWKYFMLQIDSAQICGARIVKLERKKNDLRQMLFPGKVAVASQTKFLKCDYFFYLYKAL